MFLSVQSFDDHMLVHDPEHNITNFTCYICAKQFVNRGNLFSIIFSQGCYLLNMPEMTKYCFNNDIEVFVL